VTDVQAYDAFCDMIAGAPDLCIADDSTECDCDRCRAAEDEFWRDQGDETDRPEFDPPDGMGPLLDSVFDVTDIDDAEEQP
jgi:hypothetical protein